MFYTTITVYDIDLNPYNSYTLHIDIIQASILTEYFSQYLTISKLNENCYNDVNELEKQFVKFLNMREIKFHIGGDTSNDSFSIFFDEQNLNDDTTKRLQQIQIAQHQFDAIPLAEYISSEKMYNRYSELSFLIANLLADYKIDTNEPYKAGLLRAIKSAIHQKIYSAIHH